MTIFRQVTACQVEVIAPDVQIAAEERRSALHPNPEPILDELQP